MSDALGLDMRRRLFALVQSYPGLHVREAARQLDTSAALVEYHLAVLVDAGLVKVERAERYSRMFAVQGTSDLTADDRKVLGLLRSPLPLQITLALLDRGEAMQHKSLCEQLGLQKSKLSFHLQKLVDVGIVVKTPEGLFDVRDRPSLMRLLLQNQPTPAMRGEFEDLWLSLYGSK